MKKTQLALLAGLACGITMGCERPSFTEASAGEVLSPSAWSDPQTLAAHTGKQYSIHHSNLFGIPDEILATTPSDELFGVEPVHPEMSQFSAIAVEPQSEAGWMDAAEMDASVPIRDLPEASTYYNSYSDLYKQTAHSSLYNWDVFIYVENDGGMVSPGDNDKVVFYALQTDFGGGQGAHTGLQWANGTKKVNWGGYWNGVVQPANTFCGTHSCAFSWSINTPYRFRVWRLGVNTSTNRTQWGAWVKNMWNNQETFIGSFYSDATRQWITSQSTWVETIRTGTSPLSNRNIQVVFSYLTYRTATASGPISGAFEAARARANYNDWETPPPSSTQNKNVNYPFDNIWWGVQTKSIRHKFNTTRTVAAGTYLW